MFYMEIEEFKRALSKTKSTANYTSFIDVKVKTNEEHTKQIIYTERVCSKCNRTLDKKVMVDFIKPHHLTIFEASLLYNMYVLKKKPYDYANFHECIAGKEFIENIKVVK